VATWRDAVQHAAGGTRLLLEATAGARTAAFPDSFTPWRGRIGVRVRAAAQEGRANREVVAAVAAFFGLPGHQVRLESGAQDARKSLLLEGIGKAQAEALLAPRLEVAR
jgi:uncharacterized protein (TIGR00251 family)